MDNTLNSPKPQTCESAQTAEMVTAHNALVCACDEADQLQLPDYEMLRREAKAKAIAACLRAERITAENCAVLVDDAYFWKTAAERARQNFPSVTTRIIVIHLLAAMEAAHVS